MRYIWVLGLNWFERHISGSNDDDGGDNVVTLTRDTQSVTLALIVFFEIFRFAHHPNMQSGGSTTQAMEGNSMLHASIISFRTKQAVQSSGSICSKWHRGLGSKWHHGLGSNWHHEVGSKWHHGLGIWCQF
jgi:hypothetical protein